MASTTGTLHRKRTGSNAKVRSELGARSEAVSLTRPALLLDFGPALAFKIRMPNLNPNLELSKSAHGGFANLNLHESRHGQTRDWMAIPPWQPCREAAIIDITCHSSGRDH